MAGSTTLRRELERLAEPKYRDFSRKLTPTTRTLLGVRIPTLRKLAIRSVRDGVTFLPITSESSFEEVMIAGIILARSRKGGKELLDAVKGFLPLIDNWSICDIFCSELKGVKKDPDLFWRFIRPLFRDRREFYVRFAVVLLLDYFLLDDYIDEALRRLASVRHSGYYARMGTAWGFSVAFIRYPEKTLPYLTDSTVCEEVRHKAVRKVIESYRVPPEIKDSLRNLISSSRR